MLKDREGICVIYEDRELRKTQVKVSMLKTTWRICVKVREGIVKRIAKGSVL